MANSINHRIMQIKTTRRCHLTCVRIPINLLSKKKKVTVGKTRMWGNWISKTPSVEM